MPDHDREAEKPRWQLNFNTAAALFCIFCGIAILLLIPTQVEQPPLIFGQRMIALDPALFPNMVAGAFILVGALYFWASLSLREPNEFKEMEFASVINVLLSIGVMIVYAALIEQAGFIASSIAVIFVLGMFYGARDVIRLGIVAVGTPILIYGVFSRLLQVYLPPGTWFD